MRKRDTHDYLIKQDKTRQFYVFLQKESKQAKRHPEDLILLDDI